MKVKTYQIIIISLILLTLLLLILLLVKETKSCPVRQQIVFPEARTNISEETRDHLVLNSPLYPPLNRTDTNTFNSVKDSGLNVSLNDIGDDYRLLGYLTYSDSFPVDKGGNNWQLFGRMKNRHQGDYYIIPANNNYNIKIPITHDIMIGERLKDLYSLPSELRFNSVMLNQGIYNLTELPKTDFSSIKYM
jgi:hypothetical protein